MSALGPASKICFVHKYELWGCKMQQPFHAIRKKVMAKASFVQLTKGNKDVSTIFKIMAKCKTICRINELKFALLLLFLSFYILICF